LSLGYPLVKKSYRKWLNTFHHDFLISFSL
jgi:hypothetical protein